ncbi:MAG: acetolactate synthase small subunit [Blastocatellia bacterium]|nr:acetolactate synthase small subunit [Blastocatellia bacterium]MCS7157190.1 acetolactate synthase small subunit [Blastocatellia bacterium]MCX7752347.1 acetolactate synthase small subunit [Blastocatellia bacterium]MDW8167228.1 acetolactate synthase small subunit [Acidobacteriota bacterium]
MIRTIVLTVENKPGALARITGLFSARGINIESLTVARTDDPTLSHMTIVVDLEDAALEKLLRLLDRLVDVVTVTAVDTRNAVERELLLLKVRHESGQKLELLKEAEIFRARVVDVSPQSYVLELTGDEEKLEAFIRVFEKYGILELVRSGKVAMARG